jgi:hypothetical protein
MSLTFHIIYTPDTVRYLSFFVWSLLKWSDCSFRLVANGCRPEEVQHLQQLCQQSARLSFVAFSTQAVAHHGPVLNYLQAQSHDGYFCFMDSDILATGDFMGSLTPLLAQHAGVFSGAPVWQKAEDGVLPEDHPKLPGRYYHTAAGLCLGNSYFAIYDNAVLTRLTQSTGVGFDRSSWPETPPQYRQKLTEIGAQRKRYDTGKLLNLLLLARDERLIFVDSPHLCHLGGLSALVRGRRRPTSWVEKVAGWLPLEGLRQRLTLYARLRAFKQKNQGLSRDVVETRRDKERRKLAASEYFTRLLRALREEQPLPAPPRMPDPETQARVEAAAAEIVALHKEFG